MKQLTVEVYVRYAKELILLSLEGDDEDLVNTEILEFMLDVQGAMFIAGYLLGKGYALKDLENAKCEIDSTSEEDTLLILENLEEKVLH